MNLRMQLKGTKMRKGEYIQDYFTRISHIKEKLSAIVDTLDEAELVMTALNSLTRPLDSFIQTPCARKESMMFDIVWEDCIQEEARVANRESCWVELMSLQYSPNHVICQFEVRRLTKHTHYMCRTEVELI